MFSWLKKQFDPIWGVVRDDVVCEAEINSLFGKGFCVCQIRERKGSLERYVVIKAKGGDATVYVPMDIGQARVLAAFIEDMATSVGSVEGSNDGRPASTGS